MCFFSLVAYAFKMCSDKMCYLRTTLYFEQLIMARIKIHILSGCAKQRDTETCYPASDLYKSDFFGLSKRYMQSLGNDNWLILSDYHGLIWQGAMLAPYCIDLMQWKEKKRVFDVNLRSSNIEKLLISLGVLDLGMINNAHKKGKSSLSNITFILIGDTPSLRYANELLNRAGAKTRMPMINLSSIKQSLWLFNTAKTEHALKVLSGK